MIDALYQFLARLGFKEPIHPPITHMPIGLVVGALVFFLVAIIFKKKNLIMTARHVSILALLFAIPTILFGVFDWVHFYHAAMIGPIKIKMILATLVLLLLGTGIIVGSEVKVHSVTLAVIYALAFVCVIGLGYLGAGLIYGRGVEAPTPSSSQPVSAAESSGKAVFAANCRSCHPGGGNTIEPKLPLKASKKLADKAGFVAFIRSPKMPDGSAGAMPPFDADTVSDAQASDLFAFVTASSPNWE
jgi:mono/diheme cytochrome c family protein